MCQSNEFPHMTFHIEYITLFLYHTHHNQAIRQIVATHWPITDYNIHMFDCLLVCFCALFCPLESSFFAIYHSYCFSFVVYVTHSVNINFKSAFFPTQSYTSQGTKTWLRKECAVQYCHTKWTLGYILPTFRKFLHSLYHFCINALEHFILTRRHLCFYGILPWFLWLQSCFHISSGCVIQNCVRVLASKGLPLWSMYLRGTKPLFICRGIYKKLWICFKSCHSKNRGNARKRAGARTCSYILE